MQLLLEVKNAILTPITGLIKPRVVRKRCLTTADIGKNCHAESNSKRFLGGISCEIRLVERILD